MAKINKNNFLKIAITGPESTGKTELTRKLAAHYNATHIPEYARTYIEALKRPYNYLDVVHIAHRQIELEKETNFPGRYLFLDTELIITKVWMEVVFGHCPAWIDNSIRESRINLYLLCDIDIPWVEDRVRENGGAMREKLFHIYEQLIAANGFTYKIVSGIGELRLNNALAAIEEFNATSHIQPAKG
jgi:NadR type nicotinamide-nucleotide adenylyltransferase